MTLEQRVGQVFMVSTPATAASSATVAAVRDRHVGSVLLTGRSSSGVSAAADLVRGLRPSGAVRARWDQTGLTYGVLGYPVTDETAVGDGRGRYDDFRGAGGTGSVYWSPSPGAQEVHGAVRQAWADSGLTRERLGYPTSSETGPADGSERYNDFEGGRGTWRAADGVMTVTYR